MAKRDLICMTLALVGMGTLGEMPRVHAETITVAGDSNIFGAGLATPPAPGGFGGGELPPSFTFAAGTGQVLTFSSVTGLVNDQNGQKPAFGPDGLTGTGQINSVGAISGTDMVEFPMVGVFLDKNDPANPTPADYQYTASSYSSLVFSPLLQQVFFIGDGLTGTGTGSVQSFVVPSGATTLYLGFADAFGSLAGTYNNDTGSLTASFSITPATVPEPASLALLGTGILAVLGCGWRGVWRAESSKTV